MDKNTVKPLEELLDSVRDIDGFPIGKDEDILALSNPPFYTACPNPHIKEFIEEYGKPYDTEADEYHRDPFVGDVSEGKNDPIYNAHSYHTKVPHKAIMKYIEHYTDQGDIVFDGFCGTGMTGVAACELNRRFIILDLSPIASFISSNYVLPINIDEFKKEAMSILNDLKQEYGWMYQTIHNPIESNMQQERFQNVNSNSKGVINNTVWSDVLVCPYCQFEYTFFHVAVDMKLGVIHDQYRCPGCNATISKKESQKVFTTYFDSALGTDITQLKQNPVLISYTYNKNRYEKIPDQEDLRIIEKINEIEIPYWHPTNEIPKGDKTGETRKIGITHSHHFFTKRNLCIISSFWEKAVNNSLKFLITSSMINLTKM